MKAYKIFATALLAACPLVGCEDFLNLKPLNDIVLENFWNEKSDVDNMISGCYSTMQSRDFVERLMVWGEVRSDNIVAGNNVNGNVDYSNIFQENLRENNSFTKWDKFYSVINSCNLIIQYAPQVAQKSPDYTQSALRATIAEATALRSLCYFYLIRAFRDVPYTTEAYMDDNQTMALPASKFEDILNALIADLESIQNDAVKIYPETDPLYQTGRITQEAIHAMLCEMYLWKQDYAKCVYYADLVIQSKMDKYNEKYQRYGGIVTGVVDELVEGYPLISDANSTRTTYGSAYTQIFVNGNSSESIFELTYMKDNDNMLSNGAVSYCYGNDVTFPGLYRPADFIGSDVSDKSFQVFTSMYDTRAYENVQSNSDTDFRINKYTTDGASIDLTKATSDDLTGGVTHGTPYREQYCKANWIVYRLTDVMLMQAEALVQLAASDTDSKLGQAFNIVQTVYTRSIEPGTTFAVGDTLAATTGKEAMEQLVLDERLRELCFEGKRWFDLVRYNYRHVSGVDITKTMSQINGNATIDAYPVENYSGMLDYMVRKGNSSARYKISREPMLYFPVYLSETQANPNLRQNPAYSNNDIYNRN